MATHDCTTLDIGRSSKIAEIDIHSVLPLNGQPAQLKAKRALYEILRDSQFKNLFESGELRMETGISILDVVKEVKRAVFGPEGVASDPRRE